MIELQDEVWCRLKKVVVHLPKAEVRSVDNPDGLAEKMVAEGLTVREGIEGVLQKQVLPCLEGEVQRWRDEGEALTFGFSEGLAGRAVWFHDGVEGKLGRVMAVFADGEEDGAFVIR